MVHIKNCDQPTLEKIVLVFVNFSLFLFSTITYYDLGSMYLWKIEMVKLYYSILVLSYPNS